MKSGSTFSGLTLCTIILISVFNQGRSKADSDSEEYTDEEMKESKMMQEESERRKGHNGGIRGRVVGGVAAHTWINQYQVTLQSKSDGGAHFCGGTIYNTDTIITAAHCFFHDAYSQVPASDISVVAGEYDLTEQENTEQRRDITLLTLFPGYRLYPGYNDVAILKLNAPLRFNPKVHSIRIADEGEEPRGRARVSGWGYSRYQEENDPQHKDGYPETLLKVDLEIIDKETCIRKHQNYAVAHAKHKKIICAGTPNGAKGMDSCQGDSGGPLVCKDERGGDYLCGIVQAGFRCGTGLPGFYTKVSEVRNFIIITGGSQVRGNFLSDLIGNTRKYYKKPKQQNGQ